MFFGTSMVECTTGRSGGVGEDDDSSSCDTLDSADSCQLCGVEEGDSLAAAPAASSSVARKRHLDRKVVELEAFMNDYNRSIPNKKIGLATAAMLSGNNSRMTSNGGGGGSTAAASILMNGPSLRTTTPGILAASRLRAGKENMTILKLLLNQKEVKTRLVRLVQNIYRESIGKEAGFHCMPDNSDIIMPSGDLSGGGGADGNNRLDPMAMFGSIHNRRAGDSQVILLFFLIC
jgi:hypothetical protein